MTEKDIVTFYPFAPTDGSIGIVISTRCPGTHKLLQHTVENYRDSSVVALINGEVRASMMTGKKVTDGILSISPAVLLPKVVLLQAKYPIMGKEKEFTQQKKKALDALKRHGRTSSEAVKASATPKPSSLDHQTRLPRALALFLGALSALHACPGRFSPTENRALPKAAPQDFFMA